MEYRPDLQTPLTGKRTCRHASWRIPRLQLAQRHLATNATMRPVNVHIGSSYELVLQVGNGRITDETQYSLPFRGIWDPLCNLEALMPSEDDCTAFAFQKAC